MKRFHKLSILSLWFLFSDALVAEVELRDVAFRSGEISLAGSLWLPSNEESVPGVVLVHGSGPGPRDTLEEFAGILAELGLAVLAYDKRGSGLSGGDWNTSSLEDLAADAVAAFRFLSEQPLVDSSSIGFWGISQGGWIVPLAAQDAEAVFAIVVTGGGLSPREIELARYRSIVAGNPGAEDSGVEPERLFASYFDYLTGDLDYPTIRELMSEAEDEPWFAASRISEVLPDPENRAASAWVADFEPRESIGRLTTPLLVFLGGRDSLTPSEPTRDAWQTAFNPSQPKNRVIVIEAAGHGMRTEAHGGDLVPAYLEAQAAWLRQIDILNAH